MDLNEVENFLQQYQLIITIILVPTFSAVYFVIKILIASIQEKSKKIDIKFLMTSSIVCPNHSLKEIEIINNKKKKLILDKIELTVYDNKNEYFTELYNKTLEIQPESVMKLELSLVSHYGLDGEFVDIHYLFSFKNAYFFTLYRDNKKIYVHKNYKFSLRKRKRLSDIRIKFEEIVHSSDWDYGFNYEINNKKFTGFFNKKRAFSHHFCEEFVDDSIFTSELISLILSRFNAQNIVFKKLVRNEREYIKVVPRILGQEYILEKTSGTRENPVVLTDKDVLSFTKETE